MTICVKCGNAISKPAKAIKNQTFTIEAYECNKCGNKFKVIT